MTTTKPAIPFQAAPIVQVKAAWSDEWATRPDLLPMRATSAVAPTRSVAEFVQYYGRAVLPGSGRQSVIEPARELAGQFIRLAYPKRFVTAGDGSEPSGDLVSLWQGVIVAVADAPGGVRERVETGKLAISAAGMDYLLENTHIHGSYVEENYTVFDGSTVTTATLCDSVLPFNFAMPGGLVRGNRSTEKIGGSYVFSDSGQLWTALDAVEYLLTRFGPSSPTLLPLGDAEAGYSGTVGALSKINGSWTCQGSVAATLNVILNRRRGLTWKITQTAAGESYFDACSLFDEPVESGAFSFPAASWIADLKAEDLLPTDSIEINRSMVETVDEIYAMGKPLWVCGEVPLKPAWSGDLQTKFLAASPPERIGDGFEGVYTHYDVDIEEGKPFCRHVANLETAGSSRMTDVIQERLGCPTVTDEGEIDFALDAPIVLLGKTLTRDIPLGARLDYTGASTATPPEGEEPPSEGDEIPADPDIKDARDLLKARAYIYDYDGQHHAIMPTDAMARFRVGAANVSLTIRRDATGIELRPPYRHYIGSTDADSPYRYDGLYLVAALRTDEKLKVVKRINPSATNLRRLVLDVPSAECWVARRGTIWGGTDTYGFKRFEKDLVIRNDADQLRAAAALAETWYARPRRAVSLRRKYLQADILPGDLLRNYDDGDTSVAINTVVTSLQWEFETMTTTVETDFGELDFAGIVARRPAYLQSSWGMPSIPSGGLEVRPAAGVEVIQAKITASQATTTATDLQWKYSWEECVFKIDANGKLTAETRTGGRTGSYNARNTAETINPSATGDTHPTGNGAYPDQLDVDGDSTPEHAIEPVHVGTPVTLREVITAVVGAESTTYEPRYYFQYSAYPISGSCTPS